MLRTPRKGSLEGIHFLRGQLQALVAGLRLQLELLQLGAEGCRLLLELDPEKVKGKWFK